MTGAFYDKTFRAPPERAGRSMPWEGLELLDRELVRLGRGAGAMRLRLAEAMEAFFGVTGHFRAGYSSFRAWAEDRLERRGRWAEDSRAVARRLGELPALRRALGTGVLSWSAAEVLSRHGGQTDEAELLEMGRTMTVRQLRGELKRRAERHAEDDEPYGEAPERSTLEMTIPVHELWAWEATRRVCGVLAGTRANDAVMEALLAEGSVRLASWTDQPMPDVDAELGREWREEMARWRREALVECEQRIPREVLEPLTWEEEVLPTGWLALDARCRELSADLAERDLLLGQLALRLFESDGWRKLGYATEAQYCHERLGMSFSAVKQRMTLARRTRRASRVADAVEAGEIGFEAACLLARVADDDNAGAWVQRARRRTLKHLRQEIDCVETLARVNRRRGTLDPPDEETLKGWFEIECMVLSGEAFGFGQMSGGQDGASQMSGGVERDDEPVADVLLPSAGTTRLRLSLRHDLFAWYRALKQVHARMGRPESFLMFLLREFWSVWGPTLAPDGKWAHIYRRDRQECSCPTCSRRDVTPHHLKFQSHGGGDEDDNLVTLCAQCHIFGVHEGRLTVSPPASHMVWRLGETPVVEIAGRERTNLR